MDLRAQDTADKYRMLQYQFQIMRHRIYSKYIQQEITQQTIMRMSQLQTHLVVNLRIIGKNLSLAIQRKILNNNNNKLHRTSVRLCMQVSLKIRYPPTIHLQARWYSKLFQQPVPVSVEETLPFKIQTKHLTGQPQSNKAQPRSILNSSHQLQ